MNAKRDTESEGYGHWAGQAEVSRVRTQSPSQGTPATATKLQAPSLNDETGELALTENSMKSKLLGHAESSALQESVSLGGRSVAYIWNCSCL